MKKSSIWKLLFSALTVFAVAVFAGCTDDNDDMGAPYLNVTPENLTFDAEGQPADEYNGTFIVETNRPWRAIVEDEQTWVRLSATEGEGDAAVTVTVPASNIGQSAKVTFEVYNSYGALIQKDVNVLQGEVVPPTIISTRRRVTKPLMISLWFRLTRVGTPPVRVLRRFLTRVRTPRFVLPARAARVLMTVLRART